MPDQQIYYTEGKKRSCTISLKKHHKEHIMAPYVAATPMDTYRTTLVGDDVPIMLNTVPWQPYKSKARLGE